MDTPGTFSLDAHDVEQGTSITVGYSVVAEFASELNWIGVWPEGRGPVDGVSQGPSATWVYAPGESGTVAISSGELGIGDYQVYYLYDDGYTALADPQPLTVREVRFLPPPRFSGAFGRRLHSPAGMCADDAGRLWVADSRAHRVQVYDRHGRGLLQFGQRILVEPLDVAIDARHAYVADAQRGSVEVFTHRGRHVSTLGRGELDRPRGVAVDAAGDVLVSDVGHNRVARIDVRQDLVVGEITSGIHIPHGVAVHGDQVWVVSTSRQFDGNPGVSCFVGGELVITLGYGQHSSFGGLSNPAHVAVARSGLVHVSVPDFGFVARFRQTGAFVGQYGTSGQGLLRCPQGVVVGRDGELVVADTAHHRIATFEER